MRRKLIKQEAFETIANSSVTNVELELSEAETIVARALGKDHLKLHSFNESTVMYETLDDTYVHAGFDIKNNQITFTDMQELIVDQQSRKEKAHKVLGEMLDAIVTDKTDRADEALRQYLDITTWNETKKAFEKKDDEKGFFGKKGKKDKGGFPFKKKNKKEKGDFFGKVKSAGKKVEEAYTLAENVLDYVKLCELGPALSEAIVNEDAQGNVVDLRIPTAKARNENKIQSIDWKTLNSKVKSLREQALAIHGDQNFIRAVNDLQAATVQKAGVFDGIMEQVVQAFPQVLYVTEAELTQAVGEALRIAGAHNFDDNSCSFIAEGILRNAHSVYEKRVNQLLHLASAPKCEDTQDKYEHFEAVMEGFFDAIDEKFGLERKVFSDLYESLESLYRTADRRGDNNLKHTTASYLNDLADVLNENAKPDLKLAEEVASWLQTFIETSLEGGEWTVSNTPHITVTGDHPQMAKNATVDGIPGKYKGGWGDEAPMIGQDSMTYKGGKHSKAARSNSWGNEAGKDTYPSLHNPYVPKPFGDYTMKGEKGVDKDAVGQHHSTWKSKDTWPNLQNPYVPKAETNKTYKMNKGKEKDLVIDK